MTISKYEERGRVLRIFDGHNDQVIATVGGPFYTDALTISINEMDRHDPVFFTDRQDNRDQVRAFGEALIRWAETGGL